MNKDLETIYKDDIYEVIRVSYKKVCVKYDIPIMFGDYVFDKIRVAIMFKKDDPLNEECNQYTRMMYRTSITHKISCKHGIKIKDLVGRRRNMDFGNLCLKSFELHYLVCSDKWIRSYKLKQLC